MNREQAINYLFSSGFTNEQVCEVVRALTYEPTTKNDLGVDCIDRADARKAIIEYQYSDGFCEEHNIDHSINTSMALLALSDLPSVTPQEPRCKDCKWWKDSDGKYRRGCGAESQCPINTNAVYCGEGYCYMFSPKIDMREVEE